MAEENWQNFNNLWYGKEDIRLDDPSVSLNVGDIEHGIQTIIVLLSYVTMFDHIWARAFQRHGPGEGVIITGQPDIGVSLHSLLHFQDG